MSERKKPVVDGNKPHSGGRALLAGTVPVRQVYKRSEDKDEECLVADDLPGWGCFPTHAQGLLKVENTFACFVCMMLTAHGVFNAAAPDGIMIYNCVKWKGKDKRMVTENPGRYAREHGSHESQVNKVKVMITNPNHVEFSAFKGALHAAKFTPTPPYCGALCALGALRHPGNHRPSPLPPALGPYDLRPRHDHHPSSLLFTADTVVPLQYHPSPHTCLPPTRACRTEEYKKPPDPQLLNEHKEEILKRFKSICDSFTLEGGGLRAVEDEVLSVHNLLRKADAYPESKSLLALHRKTYAMTLRQSVGEPLVVLGMRFGKEVTSECRMYAEKLGCPQVEHLRTMLTEGASIPPIPANTTTLARTDNQLEVSNDHSSQSDAPVQATSSGASSLSRAAAPHARKHALDFDLPEAKQPRTELDEVSCRVAEAHSSLELYKKAVAARVKATDLEDRAKASVHQSLDAMLGAGSSATTMVRP